MGNCVAAGVKVASDVAVVVIAWNVDHAIDCEVKQTTDAARALQHSRQILAPIIADSGGRAVRVGDALLDEVPSVVEERCGCFGRYLLHAAGFRVVEVCDEQYTIRRYSLEPIGSIIGV